jgi:hypothetical protein
MGYGFCMPWAIHNDNPECDGWAVVVANDGATANDGKVVGCHDTEAKAEAQRRALYANTNERPPRTFRVSLPPAASS